MRDDVDGRAMNGARAPVLEHGGNATTYQVVNPGITLWFSAEGSRFYNFDGLDRFKAKFQPESWEPVYAIANQPRFSPRMLYAIEVVMLLAPRANLMQSSETSDP